MTHQKPRVITIIYRDFSFIAFNFINKIGQEKRRDRKTKGRNENVIEGRSDRFTKKEKEN